MKNYDKDYIKHLVDTVYVRYKKGAVIDIPDEYMDEYVSYFNEEYKKNKNSARSYARRKFMRNKIIASEYGIELKNILTTMYSNDEYGLKTIAKFLTIGYSECRTLFDILDIPIRKGYKVVTNRVCKFRSEKLKSEYKTRTGFFTNLERKTHTTQRGVQGYYWNMSKNKYVWIRSSYEFIYAKYLDKIKSDWDVECKTYIVNGRVYKPDFFIFDNDVLYKIVEIKGYWDDKEWKSHQLNEDIDVDVVVVKDIQKYIPNGSSYGKELKQWKQIRILNI
jgi:hypothetical protein